MRHWLAAVIVVAGCGKELNPKFCAAHPDDERCAELPDARRVDGAERAVEVAHLGAETELMLISDVDVTVDSTGTAIDTTAGTITPQWPGAVILSDVPQEDGPPVMVVQVGSLTVTNNADVIEVDGSRPLVLVATRTISIEARINVSADNEQPGPGGYPSETGPGAGTAGQPDGTTGDGGGGGGSYGAAGGRGGNPMGGAAGAVYGSALRLEGGSGGGVPSLPSSSCPVRGGAGGGAIQLTALESISIKSVINAGGSGGAGGVYCSSDGSGGGGGGSGGMIYLEAPMLLGSGSLGALGGGGGEAANSFGATGIDGSDAGTTSPGRGGVSSNSGGDGGDAASDGTVGAQGVDAGTIEGNGGGGGGGGGRIYYKTTGASPDYKALPTAVGA